MNYFVVGFISIVVVGIMEVVKKFLPENVNAKVIVLTCICHTKDVAVFIIL